jgi:hypothetical protein
MKNLLDFDFINFYVDKKYGKTLSDYFSVSKSIVSKWRYELPEQRLHEFVFREGSKCPIQLIKNIYTEYKILSFIDSDDKEWEVSKEFCYNKIDGFKIFNTLPDNIKISKVEKLDNAETITDQDIITKYEFCVK